MFVSSQGGSQKSRLLIIGWCITQTAHKLRLNRFESPVHGGIKAAGEMDLRCVRGNVTTLAAPATLISTRIFRAIKNDFVLRSFPLLVLSLVFLVRQMVVFIRLRRHAEVLPNFCAWT